MRFALPAAAALLAALAAGSACAAAGPRRPLELPAGVPPPAPDAVAAEVGRLLSADAQASREAEARLLALDADGRAALGAYASTLPREDDPRWLHVLDALGMWGERDLERRVSLDVWRAGRDDPATSMRGQAGLLEAARASPDALVARLSGDGPGRDAVALALGAAGIRDAVPALIAYFAAARTARDRRAAAEAIARLAGEDLRPRWYGTR
jgi:hypothetical protein